MVGSDAMNDLAAWLERLGLGRHAAVLAENDVDLDVLPHLTDDDLKELGLSLGHRRKLLTALQDEAPKRPEAAPDAEPETEEDAERRQLTVMFRDLAGSTELSQKLDPELLREVLRRYHEAVGGVVTAHRGHVAKLLGDGVLAYFGWPQAHEDQAKQAIRAALAATAAVGGIEGAGEKLAARAGIATGRVVIGDMIGAAVRERGAVAGETPRPAHAAMAGAVQWVASCGGGARVRRTNASTRACATGALPGGRVLSRRSPSTPSVMNRSCQRHTQVFDLPARRMISIVPQPDAVRRMIRARQTCFWRVFRPAMMSESRLWPAAETVIETSVRMTQTRTETAQRESQKRTLRFPLNQ